MKWIRFLIAMGALLPAPIIAGAQVTDCAQFPAPCPHNEEITQAMDFAGREEGNTVTPQEMAMESKLRNAFTEMLHRVARQKHWQLYELMESDFDRPNSSISFDKWRATPYKKRPPHAYFISFIVIVNKDSLQAWRDWYKGGLTQNANQVVEDIKADAQRSANDGQLQALTDSVQYYAQLSGKYTQDHYAEFMTAIKNNDQKGQQRYNNKIAWYQKRQDVFMKKMQDHSTTSNSASASSYNRFAADKVNKTASFTNASLLLVHFEVNPGHAGFGVSGDDDKHLIPQKPLNIPGAFYAGVLHNLAPPDGQSYLINENDYVYDHPSDIATILFGKWQNKRDSNNYQVAAYLTGKASTDLVSEKSAKCDAVQNIVLQIEGRPDKINEALNGINFREIQQLLQ